jgi:hypothetical protein
MLMSSKLMMELTEQPLEVPMDGSLSIDLEMDTSNLTMTGFSTPTPPPTSIPTSTRLLMMETLDTTLTLTHLETTGSLVSGQTTTELFTLHGKTPMDKT